MSKKYINTLDFYGYRENNRMEPVPSKGYKVKVSDKDGNIITIEKDDSLYACVKLAFDTNTGVLSLLDVAHDDSVLAEIEMPNADYIYNCRFDEELNAILFDVKSLYGSDTETIELDVESLVELYEAGQGIEIGEKNEETGRKPISVKLAEEDGLLTLTDDGLGIDAKVVTEDELEAAISGKADVEWVEEVLSGLSGVTEIIELVEEHDEEIQKLQRIVGTDEEVPSLFEQIEDNREDIAQIDEEMGELSGSVATIGEKVDAIEDSISGLTEDVEALKDALEEEVERATSAETELQGEIDAEAGRAISAETELNEKLDEEIEARKASSVASADYDSNEKLIKFYNANDEVIDSIDATAFIKDGMVDSVELVEISGDTYLHIVFNTDAGKEDIYINIGDIFNADNYYTKDEIDEKVTALQEMDAALANVDTQQWAVINQNRQDMETVDGQLWAAIGAETENRRNADLDLWNALSDETNARTRADQGLQSELDVEKEQREAEDTRLNNALTAEAQARIAGDNAVSAAIDTKIAEERTRAQQAEDILTSNLNAEIQRATREEARIETKYDNDIEDLRQADRELRQYINDQDAIINHRVDGLISDLESEENARITADQNLSNEIQEIRLNYATREYVDTRDGQIKDEAISTSINSAKTYTDNEVDALETELKQYCDDEHQELIEAISDNATKINVISNLKGVVGDDASHYDDTGNGILDVLHREFHQLVVDIDIDTINRKFDTISGAVDNNTHSIVNLQDSKFDNVEYNSSTGKIDFIANGIVKDSIDLSQAIGDNYYTKDETDARIEDAVSDVDDKIAGKVDTSAFTEAVDDLDERVSTNASGISDNASAIAALLDKLGYTNNDTLVTNNPNEAAFGQYNISNTSEDPSGQTIFSIGNGTDDENRSNAVEVRKDGSLYLWVEGDYMNVNLLLSQIAHEVYDSSSNSEHNSHFFDGD